MSQVAFPPAVTYSLECMDQAVLVASVVAGMAALGGASEVAVAGPASVTDVQRPTTLSAEEVTAAREAARAVGSVVWSAESEDDLHDILDACLDDDTWTKTGLVMNAWARRALEDLPDGPSLLFAVGRKVGRSGTIIDNMVNSARVNSALAKVLQRVPPQNRRPRDFGEEIFTYPSEVLHGFLDMKRFVICATAMIDFAISDRLPPISLIEAVARRWVIYSLSYIRVMAMIYDANDLLVGLIPPNLHLDKGKVFARAQAREEAFARFTQDGRSE
jgi:hypothetical protein